MGTEIAEVEQRSQKVQVQPGARPAAFVPQTLDEMWRISQVIANSGMAPKAFGNDPNKAMVGIMAGAEVGLSPFTALQSIAVIGGNPSLWGDGALAVVQASGLLEDVEETDDGEEATCKVCRVGRKTAVVSTFSMDDAKKAGLAGKAGPWTQYPKRMRKMRARAFALRDAFPDVLKGLHIAEEVRDYAGFDDTNTGQSRRLTGAMLLDQAKPAEQKAQTLAEELDDEIPHLNAKVEQHEAELANEGETAGQGEPEPDQEPEAAEEEECAADRILREISEAVAAADTKSKLDQIDKRWANHHRNDYSDEEAAAIDKLITERRKGLK